MNEFIDITSIGEIQSTYLNPRTGERLICTCPDSRLRVSGGSDCLSNGDDFARVSADCPVHGDHSE